MYRYRKDLVSVQQESQTERKFELVAMFEQVLLDPMNLSQFEYLPGEFGPKSPVSNKNLL